MRRALIVLSISAMAACARSENAGVRDAHSDCPRPSTISMDAWNSMSAEAQAIACKGKAPEPHRDISLPATGAIESDEPYRFMRVFIEGLSKLRVAERESVSVRSPLEWMTGIKRANLDLHEFNQKLAAFDKSANQYIREAAESMALQCKKESEYNEKRIRLMQVVMDNPGNVQQGKLTEQMASLQAYHSGLWESYMKLVPDSTFLILFNTTPDRPGWQISEAQRQQLLADYVEGFGPVVKRARAISEKREVRTSVAIEELAREQHQFLSGIRLLPRDRSSR